MIILVDVRMDFRVLGPLEVFDGDRRLTLGGAKQQIVLELLLLHANEVVSSGSLAEAIWGSGGSGHRTNLHVYIANLRRELEPGRPRRVPPERLLSRASGYLLRVHADELDLHRFHRLVDEAAAQTVSDPETAVSLLTSALRLWRGAPLPALAAGPAPPPELNALAELRLAALEERIDLELVLGRHAGLIGQLEMLVAEHVSRERLRRQLVLALYRTGRQAEALTVCRRWRAVLVEEQGIEPSPDFQELERAVLRQEPALAAPQRRNGSRKPIPGNLPLPATELLGRSREVNAVTALLRQPGVRLVTLCGPGGVGKTRLALQVAAAVAGDFPDGVYFVALAPITDPALVLSVISGALEVKEEPGRSLTGAVRARLRGRRILVVLDNFEHLRPAAPVVAELLTAGDGVHVLVTSQAALRIRAEHRFVVPPLALPDAVRLFAQRAAAVQPGYEAGGESAPTVAAICDRLDRLPLAIELAAARAVVLSPPSMLRRLEKRLELLDNGPVDTPKRHRTLRDALKWSFELLEPGAQALFPRLAGFNGPFTMEAVDAVCAGPEVPDPLGIMESLLGHSLVQRESGPGDQIWFSVLPTIREYAEEVLARDPAAGEVRRRHAEFYCRLAEASARPLETGEQVAILRRLGREEDNFRLALRNTLAAGWADLALRITGALWHYWEIVAHFAEGRRWLEAALAAAPGADPLLRAGAYTGAGSLTCRQGEYRVALGQHREALRLYENAGDRAGMAFSHNNIGVQLSELGEAEAAVAHFEQARALTTDPRLTTFLLCNLAENAYAKGDNARAKELHEEAFKLAGELGDGWLTTVELYNLGIVELAMGQTPVAAARFRDGLASARRLGDNSLTNECIHGLASVAAANGQDTLAARLFAATGRIRDAHGTQLSVRDRTSLEEAIAGVRQRLGEAAFRAAWEAGDAMSAEDLGAEAAGLPHIGDQDRGGQE